MDLGGTARFFLFVVAAAVLLFGLPISEGAERTLNQKAKIISRLLVLKFSRTIKESNLTQPCLESMGRFASGLEKLEKWSLNMFDSTAKMQAGLFRGVLMELGSFDQCLDLIVKKPENDDAEFFRGQYCLVQFRPSVIHGISKDEERTNASSISNKALTENFNTKLINKAVTKDLSYWVGLCLPSLCLKDDVQRMIKTVSKSVGFVSSVMECQVTSRQGLTFSQIIPIVFMLIIAGIVVIGTVIDIKNAKFDHLPKIFQGKTALTRLVKSFSIYTNTKKLLSSSGQTLGCFHGIRFFTACWIIIGHTYFLPATWYMIKLKNLYGFKEFKTNLALAAIENFSLSVDTFFFISGVLMTYTTWKTLQNNNGETTTFTLFAQKYWRLTPNILVAMGIPFILPLIGSGPLWNIGMKQGIEACKSNWWANLLYIQNFWNFTEICLPHSWYLATLMQCHVVGIPLVLISFRWKIAGLLFGLTLIVASLIAVAFLTYLYNLTLLNILITNNINIRNPYMDIIYIKPYTHLPVYIVGMIIGYVLYHHSKNTISLFHQIIGWIIAVGCNMTVLYTYREYKTRLSIIIYSALHRVAWSIGLAWLTYACATGMAGFVNNFLSWKPFAVLGQLSYWCYLIHYFFLLAKSAYVRDNFYFNHFNMLYTALGHIVLSFAAAYVLHITVEMPFRHLEKLIFNKSKKQKPEELP